MYIFGKSDVLRNLGGKVFGGYEWLDKGGIFFFLLEERMDKGRGRILVFKVY